MDISDSLWQNMVYIQKIELKEINGWIKLYIREMSGCNVNLKLDTFYEELNHPLQLDHDSPE